ncbi:alanine dehydrogenase [Aestuariicella hydrocarbonica]|uniref:Alanine dehydrogenase n=1 Tax=Pseudomaricurvus hydrocarbonicus TaxID=1470433 RepID=A0A9E5MMQ1_9GAMM|nr:alanine dehydrogenase [Aestuariicella hydrocarbonica]NHO67072.1 alanine dehydrogenase [Aestuariicella hydrocarbonica]
MLIGVPKEIKNHEYRIGLTPASVRELTERGHQVIVETQGGAGIGFDDEAYVAAGAKIIETPEEIFATADMIVKVKEPQPHECRQLREGQLLFTYLHLAADPEQAKLLAESGASCVAYETVTDAVNGLPLLAPMSEVAGRLSVQAGAYHLQKAQGGMGALLGGVPGVAPAKVLVIGGGVVGTQAAMMAVGLGAEVTLLDRSLPRLRQLDTEFAGRVKCVYSSSESIESYALEADLVIGAVLIPGAAAPKLLTRDLISRMKQGSVVVDVAIDQGGCFETSVATTHQDPTYVVDGVIHYCVANMPGAVARTSTMALTNATLPFVIALADQGVEKAVATNPHLLAGLNIYQGKVTCEAVAQALNLDYVHPAAALPQTVQAAMAS